MGTANEGAARVEHIRAQIGPGPIALGDSGGERGFLEWAQGSPCGGLAAMIDDDDPERDFAYENRAATSSSNRLLRSVSGWDG